MVPLILEARVKNLIKTEPEWLISDPVILDGEIAYVRFGNFVNTKAGDGSKKFSQLQYNLEKPAQPAGNLTPSTVIGPPTSPRFWFAEKGTYPNAGGLQVTGDYGIVIDNGLNYSVTNLSIDLANYTKNTNVYRIPATLTGTGFVKIDANGTVTTSGQLFCSLGADYETVAEVTTPIFSTGYPGVIDAFGLNFIYFSKIDHKIRVYNFKWIPINESDFQFLGTYFNSDPTTLNSNSDRILIQSGFKRQGLNDIVFEGDIEVNTTNHTVRIPSFFSQEFGGGFRRYQESDYISQSNPAPFTFNYDGGFILQTLQFDPADILDNTTASGYANPVKLFNQSWSDQYDTSRKIIILQIISNNVYSKYGYDKISLKSLLKQAGKARTVNGSGNINIAANGEVTVTGSLWMQHEQGYIGSISNGTTQRIGGASGLMWLVFNRNDGKVYLYQYSSLTTNPFDYDVIGYLFDVNIATLQTLATNIISVKGEFKASANTIIENNSEIFGSADMGLVDYFDQWDNLDYIQVILYSQSLGMGWEAPEVIPSSAVNIPGNFMVGDKPSIGHGNNGSNTLSPLVATYANNCGEPPIVSAVNAFSKLYRRFKGSKKFIATSCGEGGQSIELLSKNCTNAPGGVVTNNLYHTEFLQALDRTKDAVIAEGKTVGCPVIIWMQGEYNYGGPAGQGLTPGSEMSSDKNTYKAYLLQLKNDMQYDVQNAYPQGGKKPLFFLYQVAGAYISNDQMTINMAFVEFARENEDVILMNPTYQTPDYGGGHLSTNGYRWYGELIAKSLVQTLVKGERFQPVTAEKFSRTGPVITITCRVPVAPLVIDTWTKEEVTSYGFRVLNNGVEVPINSVVVSGNSIILTLSSDPSGPLSVTYAGVQRNGSGNVRDSDSWRSMYNYYDDTATHPEKPENYTPLDKPGGNKIYGKPYPMQNWLSHFYKVV